LAIIELSRQDHDAAIRLLLELVNAEPKQERAYFALARAYYDKEQYANSLNIYRMLLEVLPPKSEKRETVRINMRRLETLLNR
jgi:cytochrome c-type biogenesis protein CcmH/NrfG